MVLKEPHSASPAARRVRHYIIVGNILPEKETKFFLRQNATLLRKKNIINCMKQETVTIPKIKYQGILSELDFLRNTSLYQRLLEFEENIRQGKKFSRKDLGF